MDHVLGEEADQVARFMYLIHHLVANIDAGGTINTLQLGAFADIDPGRANINTQAAIHAVAFWRIRQIFPFKLAAGFASFIVISDNERVLVDHYTLQPAVGAKQRTNLLAYAAVNDIKHNGKNPYAYKTNPMAGNRFHRYFYQSIAADDIGQEGVRDQKGYKYENNRLGGFLKYFLFVPRPCIQLFALVCVSLYPYLNFAEDHLHKNGLGANPPAKYAAEGNGKQHNANNKNQRSYHEQKNILRPKNLAQQYKLPVDKV